MDFLNIQEEINRLDFDNKIRNSTYVTDLSKPHIQSMKRWLSQNSNSNKSIKLELEKSLSDFKVEKLLDYCGCN
jgi:hypothetical protein